MYFKYPGMKEDTKSTLVTPHFTFQTIETITTKEWEFALESHSA